VASSERSSIHTETSQPAAEGQPAGPPASQLVDDTWHATVDRRSLEILARRRNGASGMRRRSIIRRSLAAADLVGLAIAFVASQLLFGLDSSASNRFDLVDEFSIFAATLPVWLLVARLYGLYDRDEERTDHSTVDDFVGVLHLVTIGAWLFVGLAWITKSADPNMPKVMTFWALAIALVTLGRAAVRTLCRRSVRYVQNTVIVGASTVGRRIARKLEQHPEYGLQFVGFVDTRDPGDANGSANGDGPLRDRLLGEPGDLHAIVYLYDVERVIVAHPRTSDEITLEVIRSLRDLPVQVDIVPRFFDLVSADASLHHVEGLPLMGLNPFRLSRPARVAKRVMDVVVSSAALLVLSPLFAAIAVAIRRDSPGPILFRQVRIGSEGRPFEMLKFRTMIADADERKTEVAHLNKHIRDGGDPRMFKVPDDPRVTRVGRRLRRYSLDELPQLINVLKGEMSLVGPRPLIVDEDCHVRDWGRRRSQFTPGITGPWQVLGRTQIPFDEMIRLDYLYVTEWSLAQDLKWLLRTIPAVIRPSDAH
jgi:exopolysaccharide biosynthesis polyprenyl glycosylphosphotransferase